MVKLVEANEEEAVALLPGRGRNRGRNRGPNKETNTSKRRRTDGNAEPETAQQANEDSDTPATTDAASGRTETTASLSEKVDRRRLEMLSLPSKPSLTVPSTGGRRARRIPRVRNRGEYLSRCERCSEMYDINSRSLSQWECWSHPGKATQPLEPLILFSLPFSGDHLPMTKTGKLLHLSESPVFRNFPAGMGPFDTAYYRRAFPEGFEYSCCKRAANSPGCTLGRHSSSDAGGRL